MAQASNTGTAADKKAGGNFYIRSLFKSIFGSKKDASVPVINVIGEPTPQKGVSTKVDGTPTTVKSERRHSRRLESSTDEVTDFLKD